MVFTKIKTRLEVWFERLRYYVVYKGDRSAYLRTKGSQIGPDCDILTEFDNWGTEPYLVHLGRNVTVTHGVLFVTHDGATRVFRATEPRWRNEMGVYGRILVGDNVFIGVNSVILPGVSIGSNVIIGAGSIVTKDIPSNKVVGGNPARILCSVDEYKEHALQKAMAVNITNENLKRSDLVKLFWNK